MALKSPPKPKKAQPSAEDSSAFGQIAERFRRAGDLERAVSLCREGLQKFPDQLSARVTLGWALLELGKFDDAREELEHVLRRRPDNLAAIRALAELHDRAEQTMNLPMDGPGQWPPSADQIDEMAGGMVADHFRAVTAEDALDQSLDEFRPNPAAVVPPADLGLAMWSALPPTEPAVVEPAYLSISPSSIIDEPKPMAAIAASDASDVGAADDAIAALLAEAESLEALEDVGDSPVAAFESMPVVPHVEATHAPAADGIGRAIAFSDVAFEATDFDQASEPALVLDAEPDLEELTSFAPPTVQAEVMTATPFVEPVAEVETIEELTAAPVELATVVEELTAGFAEVATPVGELTAGPVEAATAEAVAEVVHDEPAFALQSQSVGDLESVAAFEQNAGVDSELMESVQLAAADLEAQPILRFDLESAAEAPVDIAPALAAAAVEPEAAAPVAIMPTERVIESAVIASAQARIADVIAMARSDAQPGQPTASLVALERFLHQVRARRRTMTESVA